MALDMWFKEDIRNILISINVANADIADYTGDPQLMTYRRGYVAALTAMAACFGINLMESAREGTHHVYPRQIVPQLRWGAQQQ